MNHPAPLSQGSESQTEPAGHLPMPRLETIRRVLVTSAWFGAVVALVAWVYLGWPWALGFAGGLAIGMANLYFLATLAQLVLTTERRSKSAIAGVFALKALVVYGGLAGLLLWDTPPALSVVAGFSAVLLVIVLKAVGRALLDTRLFGTQAQQKRAEGSHVES